MPITMLRTVQFLILAMCAMMAEARPVVRHIRSAHGKGSGWIACVAHALTCL
jgi:hypothetical protein